MALRRKQRLSDGTITAFGVRYEIPSAYRTLLWVTVRVARWEHSSIDLVDPRSGAHWATLLPLDREKPTAGAAPSRRTTTTWRTRKASHAASASRRCCET